MGRGFLTINNRTGKYELTNLGKAELEENSYVPYMHSHSKYTTFTVWDLNQLLGTGDKSGYMEIIEKKHADIDNGNEDSNKSFMKELKVIDPEGYRLLKSQDKQIKAVQATDEKYAEDKDIDWIINFWEEIWKDGGPKFEGKMISVMRNKGFQLKTAKTKTFSALRVLLLVAFIFVKSNVKNKSCHVIISKTIL